RSPRRYDCKRRSCKSRCDQHMTGRDPRVRLDMRAGPSERGQRTSCCSGREERPEQRCCKGQEPQIPGERNQVVSKRVVAERPLVQSEGKARQRTNKVNLEIRCGPPGQAAAVHAGGVAVPIPRNEPKEIVGRSGRGAPGVQRCAKPVVVGKETD